MDTQPTRESSRDNRIALDLRQLVDDAEHLLHDVADTGDQRFAALRVNFEAQLQRIRTRLDDLGDSAAATARDAMRATEHTVRQHPYEVIGAAAAIGLLIGALLARR